MVVLNTIGMLEYYILDKSPGELKQNFFDFIVFLDTSLLQTSGL